MSIFRVVVGAFHVLDAGRERHGSAQVSAFAGHALEVRQAVEREIHFAGGAAVLVAANLFQEVVGDVAGLDEVDEGVLRVDAGGNDVGVNFVAVAEDDALRFAFLDDDLCGRCLRADFDSCFAGRVGNGIRDRTRAAARESPGTEGAVDFAHVVMEQNVGGSRRAHAEKRPDDAGRGHGGLEHVGLEPLVEEVDGAHGHELHLVVLVAAGQILEAAPDEEQLHQFLWIQRGRIRGDHAENGLHEAAHGLHGLAEFVVGLGIGLGVARDFAMRAAVVVHAPEIVAAGHGRERAVERKDFEAVARQVEVADDFRTQQRDHVGAHRELEARVDFFGDGGAAEHVAALEHENFLARLARGRRR